MAVPSKVGPKYFDLRIRIECLLLPGQHCSDFGVGLVSWLL